MNIRLARIEDREHLLELWEGSVRATHHFLDDNDITVLRPLVAEELAGDAVDWWVIVLDSETPIGFLGFANDSIQGLFIAADQRGRGAGKRLVAHAQSLAVGELTVDVNEQNADARRFYESLGFTLISRSPTDDAGRAFPILHMKRTRSGD